MIGDIKTSIKEEISKKLLVDEKLISVEIPKRGNADLAIPLFGTVKQLNVSLIDVFSNLKEALKDIKYIEKVELTGGFANIFVKRNLVAFEVLDEVLSQKHNYASQKKHGKTVVIDYSAPNIAKNFSVGHLRSTMIGNALKNIYLKNGYDVVGINHLGDWGTQFGRMIVAYQKWGNKQDIIDNPITNLQELYVKFHDEIKNDPTLEEQGRAAFLKLEQNDPEHVKLWRWFKDESLKEFMKMYQLLKVEFDSYDGEAFFNDNKMMDDVVKLLKDKKLLIKDQGAMIVELDDLPPALIKRKDGATLYITRDLAAILHRDKTYQFDKLLYVVGNEQKLHFEQLKKVTDLAGLNYDIEHVNFGLVLVDGKKMSTRSGRFAKLVDVIYEAKDLALAAIKEKNPSLKNQDEVALSVGLGAIIYNDLKNDRHLDVDFNLDNMLRFEGQTGPYLQYAVVRINSIVKGQKLDINKIDNKLYETDEHFELISLIDGFSDVLKKAQEKNSPAILARYLYSLAASFSSFYAKHRILVDNLVVKDTNLCLVMGVKYVLEEGLRLLGIDVLTAM